MNDLLIQILRNQLTDMRVVVECTSFRQQEYVQRIEETEKLLSQVEKGLDF